MGFQDNDTLIDTQDQENMHDTKLYKCGNESLKDIYHFYTYQENAESEEDRDF